MKKEGKGEQCVCYGANTCKTMTHMDKNIITNPIALYAN